VARPRIRWVAVYDLGHRQGVWRPPKASRQAGRHPQSNQEHLPPRRRSATAERPLHRVGNARRRLLRLDGKAIWSEENARPQRRRWAGVPGARPRRPTAARCSSSTTNEEKSYLECMAGRRASSSWRWTAPRRATGRPRRMAGTPGRASLVTGARGVRPYSLDGKAVLWECKGMSTIAHPTTFRRPPRLLYVTSGSRRRPVRRPVYAITPGRRRTSGLKSGEESTDQVEWCHVVRRAVTKRRPARVQAEYLYVLYDRGMLAGTREDRQRRCTRAKALAGREFNASTSGVRRPAVCLSEDGTIPVRGKAARTEVRAAGPERAEGMAWRSTAHGGRNGCS